ncbi:hypothetical protein FisN_16Lu308 [Fistulifera solaris]|uniref:PPM-type phosphatase domain-containing protein n=1 Tax=Fistulifera solaris TaxID=1519565 RepID=A0A1Z5KPB6_FISSO|nr:hypothetical protein FisN_16Lu308 [Fistulifera solaris]|eukprot:GAX27997.1 hypothetical protein FisN_16Lu308 [Fistulifera solaris]
MMTRISFLLLFSIVSRAASFQVGIAVIPGVDSERPSKVCQDAYFVKEITTNDEKLLLVGVLDGHGKDGHIVSQFCAERLPVFVETPKGPPPADFLERLYTLGRATRDNDSLHPKHRILIDAFHRVHYDAMQCPTCPAGRSGTTCVVCWIEPDEVHVAYVGDSRAILIDGDTITPWATETIVRKLPKEKERIDACEGRIDGNGNVWYGPVAIAMTRALGDAAMLRAGILPTPITTTFPRKKGTVLVLATDGIWDQLSNDQVLELVKSNIANTSLAAEAVSKRARQKWIGDFIEEKADDITCLVVTL